MKLKEHEIGIRFYDIFCIFTITPNNCYVGSLVSMLQMKLKDHKFGILFYDIFYIFTIIPKYCNVGSPLRLSIFCDKIY